MCVGLGRCPTLYVFLVRCMKDKGRLDVEFCTMYVVIEVLMLFPVKSAHTRRAMRKKTCLQNRHTRDGSSQKKFKCHSSAPSSSGEPASHAYLVADNNIMTTLAMARPLGASCSRHPQSPSSKLRSAPQLVIALRPRHDNHDDDDDNKSSNSDFVAVQCPPLRAR